MRTPDDPSSSDPFIRDLLLRAEQCFWHGQFPEALQLLEHLDTQEEITELERLQGQLLRCRIFVYQDVKKAQELADEIIPMSKALNQPLIAVDTYCVLAEAWQYLGKLDTSMQMINNGRVILQTIPDGDDSARTEREAMLLALESGIDTYQGPINRAVDISHHSLKLRQPIDNPRAIAHSHYHLGIAFMHSGKHESALEHLQHSLTLHEQLYIPQEIVHSLYYLARTYVNLGRHDQTLELGQRCLTLCEQLGAPHEIAQSLTLMGVAYSFLGELDQALQVIEQSLVICRDFGIPGTFAEARALQIMGYVYMQKGEWDLALAAFQNSLELQEARGFKGQITHNLAYIGEIYRKKGQLTQALAVLEQGFQNHVAVGLAHRLVGTVGAHILVYLVFTSLELNQLELARSYVTQLEEGQDPMSKLITHAVMLSRALMLKISPRMRDKSNAQTMLQQLVDDEVVYFDFTAQASLHLCELLLIEFKFSEAPEILQELQQLIQQLLARAKAQQSYYLLTETYLLQAKLALLELEVPRARQLLTQAQMIAKDKGLEKLAQVISQEHDTLLTQLPQWEALQAQEASFTETGKLAGIEEELTRLTRQRAPDPPELHPEDPVLLLIVTESGLALYSHSFTKDQQFDEHLIGGFLTAISDFGQDALAASGAIDRITYHDYTVAVKPLASLLVCYIFQGPSYLALQKLDQFLARIKKSPDLHHVLTTAIQSDPSSKALGSLDPEVTAKLQHLTINIFQDEPRLG